MIEATLLMDTNDVGCAENTSNKIGRSPENDIVITNSAFISTFHALIEVEGSNDNFICFISDLKSTNKTKIGQSLDAKSLFILTPQKNYQIKLNDYVIFGQYKCILCMQNDSGGQTPQAQGTPKIHDGEEEEEVKKEEKKERDEVKNKKEEMKDEEEMDEIERLLENNKKHSKEIKDINEIVSEHESTHLSIELDGKSIINTSIIQAEIVESEDTVLYNGDHPLEEASPSFFDRLNSDNEGDDVGDDEDIDSDMDFTEDIFKDDTQQKMLKEMKRKNLDGNNHKSKEIDEEMKEIDELIKRESSSLSEEEKEVSEVDKRKSKAKEQGSNKESLIIKKMNQTKKNEEENKKSIISTKNDSDLDDDDDDDDDKDNKNKSPFTIPITTLMTSPFSPQKKRKDHLVDLDESTSNTQPLTPMKGPNPNSPQPVVFDNFSSGDSTTLPLDVPSPSPGSLTNKRKNNDPVDLPSASLSPKKLKLPLFDSNKKSDEDESTPNSPLIKFDSPIKQRSLSPQKNRNVPSQPSKSSSQPSKNVNNKNDNNTNNKNDDDTISHSENKRSTSPQIDKKDFSFFFSATDSLDPPTESDLLMGSNKSSGETKKNDDNKNSKNIVNHNTNRNNQMNKFDSVVVSNINSDTDKSPRSQIDMDDESHEITELSENNELNSIFGTSTSSTTTASSKETKSSNKNNNKETDKKTDKKIDKNKKPRVTKKSEGDEDSDEDADQLFDKVFNEIDTKPSKKRNDTSPPITTKKQDSNPKNVKKEVKVERARSKSPSSPSKSRKTSPKASSRKKSAESPHDSFLSFVAQRKQIQENTSYKIMFTGITDKKRELIVKKLGGVIIDSFDKGCTHLITNKIRLTNKFLCGISLADHIVDIRWIDECKKRGQFVEEEEYLLSDKENEGKWKFSLKNSIEKSKKTQKLLSNLSVFCTPKLLSANPFIKEMVVAHGGSFLNDPPKSFDSKVLVLSQKEEAQDDCFLKLSRLNYKIYNLEFFLISVLKQELLFKHYTPLTM